MEFIAILQKLLLLIWVVLLQVFWFVLKLVPVWLFLTLIEKLMIWWEQITQLLVETPVAKWFLWVFVLFSWYLIIVWLLHLIVNVNVFKNALNEDVWNKWKENKKYDLSPSVVNNFRKNFLAAITSLKWNNQWENILRRLEWIKDNILIKLFFFQWWLWWNRHIKSVFDNVTRKSIWFNMVFIIAIIWLVWYAATYEKEYIWPNQEHITIWNWYDYVVWWIIWEWYDWMQWLVWNATESINDSITFRDRRIQAIAKVYYKTFLMWPIWWIDLVETEEEVINLWTTSWWNIANSELTERATSSNVYSLLRDKDENQWLPNNWIYFNEFMNKIQWTNKYKKTIDYNNMLSCMNTIKWNTALRDKYFINENLYNSKAFNDYLRNWNIDSSWKLDAQHKLNIHDSVNKNWRISSDKLAWFMGKYWLTIPWTWNANDYYNIWMYFIVWKEWSNYIINQNALKQFESDFNNYTRKIWNTYFNAKMLAENNSEIVDFCYWYSLLAPYKSEKSIAKKWWTYWKIEYDMYNYSDLLSSNITSIWSAIKWTVQWENENLQTAWYLLTNLEYYSNDTLVDPNVSKDFWNFSKYFYMFNEKQRDYQFLIWWSMNWLYSNINSLIYALEFESINDNDDINVLMKQDWIKDIVWKYTWVNKSIWEFQSQLVSTIKSQFDVIPSSKIFNDSAVMRLKTIYFNWYKQEDLNKNWRVLSNWKIKNLITWINTQIDVNDTTTIWSDWTKQKVMFFWKETQLNSQLWEWTSYKKVWALLWIFPIVESSLWFMNFVLFIVYCILYLVLLFLCIWFSWIWQFFKNYAEYKESKDENNFDYIEESIDLLVRMVIFIFILKLYFIFSVF